MTLTFLALPGKSQYIPSQPFDKPVKDHSGEYWHWGNTFQHLDVALSLGTSGIGIELAAPVCEFAQVRLGYELMPHFKKSLSADLMIGSITDIPRKEWDNSYSYTNIIILLFLAVVELDMMKKMIYILD